MDVWGYCGTCSRWFYCEQSADGEPTRAHVCPVCTSVPERFDTRTARAV